MNIIFMGTPEFAVSTLQKLIESGHAVRAVVTQPDRAKGRGQHVIAPPVKTLAEQHGIPVMQPRRVREEAVVQQIRDINPDVIVVVAYGQILPETLLRIPRLGCINVHASLLPKYRGAAPMNWAIVRGETETGVTTIFMDKGMDTGDMLLTRTIPIEPRETTATLHDKLAALGAELLIETLRQAEAGTLVRIPQDHAAATYAPLMKKEDGLIDWNESAQAIDCKVRGFFPWPGAYTTIHGKCVKVLQGEVETDVPCDLREHLPGMVVRLDQTRGPLVATGKGFLRIVEIQPENKKPMRCNDFCRGYRLNVGDRFGENR